MGAAIHDLATATMTFHPTSDDPALVTASDGTLFACWREDLHGRSLWMFMNTAKMYYAGPPYAGEDSLGKLRDLVATWWSQAQTPAEPIATHRP